MSFSKQSSILPTILNPTDLTTEIFLVMQIKFPHDENLFTSGWRENYITRHFQLHSAGRELVYNIRRKQPPRFWVITLRFTTQKCHSFDP